MCMCVCVCVCVCVYMSVIADIHVLMRDEKEGRKKQAKLNKQKGKATQHCTFPVFSERTESKAMQ